MRSIAPCRRRRAGSLGGAVSLAGLLTLGAAACGPKYPQQRQQQETDGAPMELGVCDGVSQQHPDEGRTHIPCTSPATYLTEPPSSGNHYPIWANFQTYTTPVPWGNLVHSLEHGAVVIVYNCPDTCDADVARIQTLMNGIADPLCTTPRLILAPDPTLDVRFAASAWTWTLRADCFDEGIFGDFIRAHIGFGLEQLCNAGASTPDTLCPSPVD